MPSEVNYNNPGGLAPANGWKPQGFLGGMQWEQQNTDYNDMMSLQKLMTSLSAGKELEDYTEGAPVRQSKRLSDIATNNATAATIGGQKQGELDKLTMENEVTRSTQSSKIATTIAENAVKMGEAGAKKLENSIRFAQIAGPLMQSAGPAGAAQLIQMGKAAGIDDSMVQSVISGKVTPEQLGEVLMTADKEHRKKVEEIRTTEGMRTASHLAGIHAQGGYSLQIAEKNNEGKLEAARIRAAQAGQLQNMEKRWTQLNSLISAGKGTPEMQQEVATLGEMIMAQKVAMGLVNQAPGASLGVYPRTGAPSAPTPTTPGQQQPQSQVKPATQADAVRAFGSFEPDKYEYLVGPDGRIGRRAKR